MRLTKLIVTILLLLFVAATVGTLIAQEVARPKMQVAETDETAPLAETSVPATAEISTSEPGPVASEPAVMSEPGPSGAIDETNVAGEIGEAPVVASPPSGTPCVIEAVYFHNTYRCVTCSKIENEARAIVETEFADEMAAGTLRWSMINMEEERAYINLYDLAMPSLVLIRKVAGEVVDWITLHETWSQIRSSTRFSAYIVDSFSAFLGGCP